MTLQIDWTKSIEFYAYDFGLTQDNFETEVSKVLKVPVDPRGNKDFPVLPGTSCTGELKQPGTQKYGHDNRITVKDSTGFLERVRGEAFDLAHDLAKSDPQYEMLKLIGTAKRIGVPTQRTFIGKARELLDKITLSRMLVADFLLVVHRSGLIVVARDFADEVFDRDAFSDRGMKFVVREKFRPFFKKLCNPTYK